MLCRDLPCPIGVLVDYSHQLAAVQLAVNAGVMAPHVSGADNGDT